MKKTTHRITLVLLALFALSFSPAYAEAPPEGGHAEGLVEGHGEGHEAGGHHETCQSVAQHKGGYYLNWYDLFGWKEKNAEECAKWEADKSYVPQITGPPILAAFANFAILLFLLVKFGKKPLQNFLTARHETVKRELEETQRRWEEAQARLAEYEAKLKHIEEERQKLIEQYEEQLQREVEKIQRETEQQIGKLRKDAERQIQLSLKQAEKEIRREVVIAAINTAESILTQEIGQEDRQRLIEQFIQKVSATQNGQVGGAA